METLQTAIVSREDTGPFKKPLTFTKEHCVIEDPNETNYVDLGDPVDMRSDITKTVKVTFTGEGNQLAIFKCNNDESGLGITVPGKQEDNDNAVSGSSEDLASENGEKCISAGHFAERATLRDGYLDALKPRKLRAAPREAEELRYTDMYLNSRSEPKDGSSAADAESHYITTHEIQLTELDHDVDYEFGRGSCWDYEDDNLVYSFVDYASFDSSETTLRRIKSKTKSNRIPPTLRESGALVSTESELCESDKCVSSDEAVGHLRNPAGHIHLSIKASSLGINDAASVLQENNVRFNARRAGERSQYSFRGSDSKSEALFDRFFIPPPGRQHLASKLRGKDINEYSSGASSSVSELDDADNEVRNLTARSFRSLACPYFDAINLSSSSESSMSEHGLNLNKWSAFVDLNYGSLTRDAYKDSTVDGSKVLERTSLKDAVQGAVTNTQTKLVSLKNNLNSQHASTIEIRNKSGIGETIKLTETLNLRCNVGSVMPARAKRALNAIMSRSTADAARATTSKPGGEGESQFRETTEAAGDVHNKAVFASSLLKNVISKKMQLEQERKMERGEISGAFSAPSQSKDCKETEKNWCIQSSDSESGHSQEEVHCETEQPLEKSSSPAAKITKLPCDANTTPQLDQNDKNPTSLSQANILETVNDGEQDTCDGEYQRALEDSQPDASIRPMMESSECVEGESSKMIKMSHLYVPSSQLMPKENEAPGISLHNRKVTGDPAESNGGGCGKQNSGQLQGSVDIDQTSSSPNAPEIKIHLQTVKENQSNPFKITNLLTPNIQANFPAKKPTSPKSHLLTMSDKVPHFMVRDIRDSKCKFQTPIHQVRDVRKLVKSSYRFVALENTNGTAGTSTITTFREDNKPVITGIDKILVPSPMVIKCQSVNTNSGSKPCESKTDDGEIASEASNLSPECQTKCDVPHGSFKMPHGKPPATEQPEFHFKIDAKSKQKLEKSPDCSEKKSETKVSNQIAFEKLKAAVKTMEQLYVFDRNEWKRKIRAPRPITDSHVLSLIAREDNEKITGSSNNAEKNAPYSSVSVAEDKKSPFLREDGVNQKGNSYNRCVFSTASSLKTQSCETTANESALQMLPTRSFTPKAHRLPLALKICPKKAQEKECVSHSDSDNYLTIPVKTQSDSRLNSNQPHSKPPHRPLQRSPISTESWSPDYTTSSVYHHAVSLPAVQTLPPTQPKLLLDPTTGQYYLVDTPVPVPPAAQRFYHPESGQYVDIPVSITPVPVSVSPITLSPVAAYSPTYVVYPPTLLPPQIHPAPMSRSSTCSEGEDTVETGSVYLIPPSSGVPSTTKPVISITSQQGARIVAPPSFDGTTMSFVVEHR